MTEFPKDLQEVKDFCALVSKARIDRYLASCEGNLEKALQLYVWNAQISQAFYLPIQVWEVCLRNQMNRFLCRQFSDGAWPYNELKAVRRLKATDRDRVMDARKRQEDACKVSQASTDAIVADLTAGFWVSMLATSYSARFAWRYQLTHVFPNAPTKWRDPNAKTPQWNHNAAHAPCERLLTLRNRISHHEPIFALDLARAYDDAVTTIHAMSGAAANYLSAYSSVEEILAERP